MSRLRVATEGDAIRAEAASRFAAACEAALKDVLAKEPLAVCILFETSDTVAWATVPPGECVAVGLMRMVKSAMDGEP